METLQPDFQDLVLGVAACSRPAPRPWQGLLLVTALATALVTALGEKKQVTARNILRLGGSTSTAAHAGHVIFHLGSGATHGGNNL